MKLGIICGYPIPYGMAATTRIFSYSKGLAECGDNVDVCSVITTDHSLDIENEGVFNHVSFFYSYRCKKASNKFLHMLELIYSLLISGYKLYKRGKNEKYDIFIISSDSICKLLYMRLTNLFFKCKLIFIFDEYPIPIRKKCKEKIPKWKKLAYKVVLNQYSGYISISNNLLSYYQNINNKPGIVIPSITDISRFKNICTKRRDNNTHYNIVYMGNMELSKDNVDNIIYAFAILLLKGYNASLNLYGRPNARDKQKLDKIIKDEHLDSKVSFSYATYDMVPQILSDADILVSSQPMTVRADGGFPTKLGEYLMSGTPTLLTDVGETSTYFKNKTHLYFAKPESPKDFADKLVYIINNYDEALLTAKNGKEYIISTYSHSSAGKKIHEFLEQL